MKSLPQPGDVIRTKSDEYFIVREVKGDSIDLATIATKFHREWTHAYYWLVLEQGGMNLSKTHVGGLRGRLTRVWEDMKYWWWLWK